MAHVFEFMVRVTTERTEGKFASRDEQQDAIHEMLDGANEGQISGLGDGTSEYEIVDWEVMDQ